MTALQVAHSKMTVPVKVDSPILSHVRQLIQSCCYVEVRNVSTTLRSGELILEGVVSSYYLKQIAQTVVRDIKGIVKVTNNVRVVYPASYNGEAR